MSSTTFLSPLAQDLRRFIDYKRALGCSYHREEFRLRSFDRAAAQYASEHSDLRLDRTISEWLARAEGRHPRTIRSDLAVVRQFCLFLRRRDPECFVPGRDLSAPSNRSRFLPYIFSPKEFRFVLQETRTMRPPPFRALTFRTLLLVLYCTGLRPGEATRLRLRDVDLASRTFFIAESKRKSRWVPFSDSLAEHVRRYLSDRRVVGALSQHSPLFVQPNGMGYSAQTASAIIRALFRRIDLKPSKGRVGPRPYDLRHSFACQRLIAWYKAGVDIQAHLPLLSAYMGHDSLLGTQVYLTATPELLDIASRRFGDHFGQQELDP